MSVSILGSLPRTKNVIQHVVVITDWLADLIPVISTAKKKSAHIGTMFLNNCVMPYGMDFHTLARNVPKFVRKSSKTLCICVRVKNLTKTAYFPLTNGQAERYSHAIVARLRHYILEEQRNWETHLQPLTYAYSTKTVRATENSLIHIFFPREPPSTATFDRLPGTALHIPRDV